MSALFDELLAAAALPPGVCRFCGCTDADACVVDVVGPTPMLVDPVVTALEIGCAWIDRGQRICSACAAAAHAEAHYLRVARRELVADAPPGAARAAWLRALHLGFIVGWFAVSPAHPTGRSTYLRHATGRRSSAGQRARKAAWERGHLAGTAARVGYGTVCGAVTNLPRLAVLAAYAGRQATTTPAGGRQASPPARARRGTPVAKEHNR